MPSSAILVYDIGTTSVKSALFDDTGLPVTSVSVSYRTDYPRPGWAEQDPEQFWEAAVRGTREILVSPAFLDWTKNRAAGAEIGVIGLAGHMNGCLPVDGEGRPCHPELIHSDTRGGAQCARIIERLGGESLYRETANRTNEHLSLPKMLWLKEERRDAFNRTAFFLNSKDYLRFKLTGALGQTDYSDASLTGAFNLEKKAWSGEIIDALGLSRSRFPEPGSSTETGGVLSGEAAAILGLKAGIPVSLGGGDAACATRGSGIGGAAQAYISVGSSAWASLLAPGPVLDAGRRMQHFYDLDGRSCNVCGTLQSAGAALDWAMALFTGGAPSSEEFRRIEGELEKIDPGSEGVMFLPYLMGERTPHWDADARGLFIGLTLSSSPHTLLRAVYEGVSFGLREIIEVYGELGIPVDRLVLLGGGIRSGFWRNMIAEVIGRPMLIHPIPTHAISLGAAMAAGVSIGIWENLNAAAARINLKFEEMEAGDHSRYNPYFNVYRGIYRRCKPVFDELAELRKE
jgi:xylulokinase